MNAADRAQLLEEAERQREIAAIQAREPEAAAPWFAHPTHCEECGREIPVARRSAVPGARRCVLCQLDLDRRNAWGI